MTSTRLKATLALVVCSFAFPSFGGDKHPHLAPQSGFISPEKYTNAFFGFSLPLPQDLPYHIVLPSQPMKRGPLLTLELDDGRAGLKIVAQSKATTLPYDPPTMPPDPKDIGALFLKDALHRRVGNDTLWTVRYESDMYGYLVTFSIESLDQSTAKKLEDCIKGVKFFEPGKAQEVAGPDSQPFNPWLPGQSASH
jgi:hypothetical protein